MPEFFAMIANAIAAVTDPPHLRDVNARCVGCNTVWLRNAATPSILTMFHRPACVFA